MEVQKIYTVVSHVAFGIPGNLFATPISSWRQNIKKTEVIRCHSQSMSKFSAYDSLSSKTLDISIHQGRTAWEQYISAAECQDPDWDEA